MKLYEYAKQLGISYRTAWRWYKSGKIKGYQVETGTIIITEMDTPSLPEKTVIYAGVSSADNKNNLITEVDRLVNYCAANGYQVHSIYKEVGSGVNDSRRQLSKMLCCRSCAKPWFASSAAECHMEVDEFQRQPKMET